ncbi:metallophosphoesterase family protein [Treponema sp.]
MRALVIADIHANLAAFKAVLSDSSGKRDIILCLGDLVGYGPDPNACVELALEQCAVVLAGNHDLAASGRMDTRSFSKHAREAMNWTRTKIAPGLQEELSLLPSITEYEGILLSHGSPSDPVWSYILSAEDAALAFESRDFRLCLFGHSHVPSAFSQQSKKNLFQGEHKAIGILYGEAPSSIATNKKRWLINPGSVGFPRDANDAHSTESEKTAAARYGILDTDSGIWEFHRVLYDMSDTAERMRSLGLW